MFDSLTERLNGALQRVSGRGRITEDNVRTTVRQIRMALLEADVALPVVKSLVEHVRQRALGAEVARSLNPGQTFTKIVHDEIVAALGRDETKLETHGWPTVVLLVGLQGAGKTTTAGKLAARCKREGGAVLLVSTDVYRPAAREQLATLAAEIGVDCLESSDQDPARIAAAALAEAKRRGTRWLIVDTAGRLHVDEPMMDEVRAIHGIVNPGETIFVVDSMAGQDAMNSARSFNDALPLTGVILTKADGDARGGAALSVRHVTGAPIKFIGTGEKIDALESFVPQRFASRILGMGDVVGLVERVQLQVDQEAAERVANKVKKGRELNLEDYRDQLQQLIKMGGLGALLDKLPGVSPGAMAAAGGMDDSHVKRQIALIDSMTPRERRRPDLIDGSRKRRIAGGAGLDVPTLNRLLKQHRQLAKTMKKASKGGMERALSGALRSRGGFGRPGR